MIISRSTLVGFYSLLLTTKSISATTTTLATTATTSSNTTTTTTPYAGTSKWYVDYENQRCKMDCAESAGGECSGITSDTNLDFYDTVRLCCSNKLGYLDVDFCADRSLKTPLGTQKFYAVTPDGYCLKDADPAKGATALDKLYVDAKTCCSSALGWVNSDFCESRSTGGDGYTNLWSVDYQNMVCNKDCATTSSVPECTPLVDKSATLFDTVDLCCTGKLGWINAALCKTVSTGGEAAANNGTEKYFADYSNSPPRCAKDCDTAGNPECGGVLSNVGGVQMFDTVAACCSAKFGWMSSALCASFTTSAPTNKWYVDYQTNSCKQDCAAATNSPCAGTPTDYSMQLFDDAATCCSTKLGWVQADTCTAKSETGTSSSTGTLKFYVDYSVGTCKKDCPVSATSPECGGVLSNSVGETLFSTAAACCSAKYGWIDTDLCEAMVTKGYTNKYYVSYSDNACKKDCKTATSNPECGGNPTDLATQLFATATECCSKKLSWVNSASCITKSETGSVAAVSGSLKWYVDWSISKCVKDCPVNAADTECGGLAENWENAEYTTGAACCKQRLSWLAPANCKLV